jgi:hypothetical protein
LGVKLNNPKIKKVVRYLAPTQVGISSASSTFTAGRVYLQQIIIDEAVTATGITFSNVATVAGNIYVGIYAEGSTDTPVGGAVLATSASTAQAGANYPQTISFASSVGLPAGSYYLAIQFSDATATINRASSALLLAGSSFQYDRGGGYGAFTDPCPACSQANLLHPNIFLVCS